MDDVVDPWKEFGPVDLWCFLTMDLHTLVATEIERMVEHLNI